MTRELAIQFGKTGTLTGVVTLPAVGAAGRTAFILLNSGILHRVGSCRLHVRLARRVAEAGFPALRFDFSGIGDSEARKDSLSFEESAPLEVREAMDYLSSTRDVSQFVLMGLCSGADMAHIAAVRDERVRGLVMLDAWAFRTWLYWVHYYADRVLDPACWKNWLAARLRRLADGSGTAVVAPASDGGVEYEVPKYVRRFPPQDAVRDDLRALVTRGVHMLAIFTAGQSDVYNYEGQYRRAFQAVPFEDLLEERFLPRADHIITGLEDQAAVIERIRAWGLAFFPPDVAGQTVAAASEAAPGPRNPAVNDPVAAGV